MRLRGARGVSVLELSATMGLVSLVAIPMFAFMQQANSRQREVTANTHVVSLGRLAVTRMQQEVRQARTLTQGASPQEAIVWRDLDNDGIHDAGEDITYAIADGRLTRDDGLTTSTLLEGLRAASTLQVLATPTGRSLEIHLVLDANPQRQPVVLHTQVVPRAT
jgi:hypothetical protein